MNHALRGGFPPFVNEPCLRAAIGLVCARFGRVKSLKIQPATYKPGAGAGLHCACFLRLEPQEAAIRLKSTLDVIYFGSDIAFFADVDAHWTSLLAR